MRAPSAPATYRADRSDLFKPGRWAVKLKVNGKEHDVAAPEQMPLLWVIRDLLGLTGTKYGCGMAQCGACQPGQIMAAAALLKAKRKPTDAEIDAALCGNLCRCGTYQRIRAAVRRASELAG